MINAIGKKKLFILIVLFGATLFLGASYYFVLAPQAQSKKNEHDSLKSELSTIQTEIQTMRTDLAFYEKQKSLYEKIEKTGFLNGQNNLSPKERFETLQKRSKIIGLKYEIREPNLSENPSSKETGYVTISSDVSIDVSAIDDLDIYRFIYYLNYAYPGHIKISELVIQRTSDVSKEALKAIGTGGAKELTNAKMNLTWTTMAKKDLIPPEILSLLMAKSSEVTQ